MTLPRILIVEDEALVARHARQCLEANDWVVAGVLDSGEAAVEAVGQLAPDLILMDIRLPGALSGLEAAELIHQRQDIPIVFFSGPLDDRALDQARAARPYGYVSKPFEPRTLPMTMALALERHRLEQRLQADEQFLRLLDDLARATLDAPPVADLVQMLASRVGQLFHADQCFVTRWDEACQRGVPAAASGTLDQAFRRGQPKPGEPSITAEVLNSGRPWAVDDLARTMFANHPIASLYPARALLALPLQAPGRKLGAVLVAFDRPRQFSARELVQADQVARQVSVALEKAMVREADHQSSRLMARAATAIAGLGRTAARAAHAGDVDGVLQALGAELRRLGLDCLAALRQPGDSQLLARYLSLEPATLAALEALLGARVVGLPIEPRRWGPYRETLERGRPMFDAHPAQALAALLSDRPPEALPSLEAVLSITQAARAALLPLSSGDRVDGVLLVWGEQMESSDRPALEALAGQLGLFLDNARLAAEVAALTWTDALTGTYNERGLQALGQREVERARRYARPLAALQVDVVQLQALAAAYGRGVADEVLTGLGTRLRSQTRGIDLVARHGGEAFVLLLPETTAEGARLVAERLQRALPAASIPTAAGPQRVTLSLRLASLGPSTNSLASLLADAEQASPL